MIDMVQMGGFYLRLYLSVSRSIDFAAKPKAKRKKELFGLKNICTFPCSVSCRWNGIFKGKALVLLICMFQLKKLFNPHKMDCNAV